MKIEMNGKPIITVEKDTLTVSALYVAYDDLSSVIESKIISVSVPVEDAKKASELLKEAVTVWQKDVETVEGIKKLLDGTF
jgi:hypothetical protein